MGWLLEETMGRPGLLTLTKVDFIKVSVHPKFDHFSKKMFFAFSDRSYCNLSFKKNSMKKD